MEDRGNGIWTEEEQMHRELDNLINYNPNKMCGNCHWGQVDELNARFTTCGVHLENFTIDSFCGYWTKVDDPKVKDYFKKRHEEIKKRIKPLDNE